MRGRKPGRQGRGEGGRPGAAHFPWRIEDIAKAMTPLFTTNPDGERSGMGFTVMETFMDKIEVKSLPDVGTSVTMYKTLASAQVGEKCG